MSSIVSEEVIAQCYCWHYSTGAGTQTRTGVKGWVGTQNTESGGI